MLMIVFFFMVDMIIREKSFIKQMMLIMILVDITMMYSVEEKMEIEPRVCRVLGMREFVKGPDITHW